MKTVTRTVTVYVSDTGEEYSYPTDCLNYELRFIQATHKSKLDCEPVRDFSALAALISFEPKILDKLEELALLCGMPPRTKKGE